MVQLNEGHAPTADYVKKLRRELPAAFPDVAFYFQPADMVTQVLNFGVPSQIDVQVQGRDRAANQMIAKELQKRLAAIPGIVDAHMQQELDAPEFVLHDQPHARPGTRPQRHHGRQRREHQPEFIRAGFAEFLDRSEERHSVLTSRSRRRNTVSPASRTSTTRRLPAPSPATTSCRICWATLPQRSGCRCSPFTTMSNIQPVYDVYASVQDRDLGSTAAAIRKVVQEMQGKLGPADRIVILGQIDSMDHAFTNLTIGLLFAAVFVYALMVVNYQSFVDPLAVVLALPGAGSGIILLLFATGTTFSVPSLMGAIMAVGVASANSILLVTFALEQREAGMDAYEAALSAGTTRLRPVLMTAAAMIVGMLPMAIGGPGEEQNAVLARAVIGGVAIGTITTLFFVPYLYSVFGKFERKHV